MHGFTWAYGSLWNISLPTSTWLTSFKILFKYQFLSKALSKAYLGHYLILSPASNYCFYSWATPLLLLSRIYNLVPNSAYWLYLLHNSTQENVSSLKAGTFLFWLLMICKQLIWYLANSSHSKNICRMSEYIDKWVCELFGVMRLDSLN